MKKSIKKIMCSLLIVVMCLTSVPLGGLVGLDFSMGKASAANELAESGQCGNNVYWSFDSETGELIISGTGDMEDYIWSESPFSFSNIKSVVIKAGVTSIGGCAFYDCRKLSNITIPESVASIGEEAFYRCISLTSIVLNEGLTTLKDGAFFRCENLKSITIPESINCIEALVFERCYSLTEINVDEDNQLYSSDEYGVLFNKDKTVLIQYPIGSEATKYVVPETVTSIETGAMYYAYKLEEVKFSKGMATINPITLYACFSLSRVELPDGLKEMKEGSIAYNYGITEIIIPESVEKVNDYSMLECLFLDKIYFKSMYAEIGDESLNPVTATILDEHKDKKDRIIELLINSEIQHDISGDSELKSYLKYFDNGEYKHISTIYCHSGSTAEAYAIANDMPYVLTHFFEGDWIYDYDKMIRYRKCIHCDELETEPLESTEKDDTEIIAPLDPDKDFNVDEVKPGSDNYIMVEESFKHHGPEHWKIIKAFDITMTGKDGVHTQPDGTVKVKIPGDWSKHGVYKVYRVNDDGTLTDMNAYRQGSHLVFDTDHFSFYVVVDESGSADAGSDAPTDNGNTDFISMLFAFITKIIEIIAGWFK